MVHLVLFVVIVLHRYTLRCTPVDSDRSCSVVIYCVVSLYEFYMTELHCVVLCSDIVCTVLNCNVFLILCFIYPTVS